MLDDPQRNEALLHFQRGLVLERAHRVREAVEEYRRALSYDPHLREAHGALGVYYQRHGLLAKAAEEFRMVAQIEDDFISYFNLGFVLLELRRYDEALSAFTRCMEFDPDDPAVHFEIGTIHHACGNQQAAIAALQQTLHCYPEDWEVQLLLGHCHLRLAEYDAALRAFGNALRAAPRPESQAEAIRGIQVVERYHEFEQELTVKDRLYTDHGVVYLGSAQDDGLQVGKSEEYHFTYPDIGVTLRRFHRLCQESNWHFTCVVALDRLAQPLAEALAHMFGLPLRSTADVGQQELALLVLAIGYEAELMELAIERLPCEQVTFCLGLNWLRHRLVLPDISGVIIKEIGSVPWEAELRRLRADGAPTPQIRSCTGTATEQILAAVKDAPVEPNLDEQVRYYTQYHSQLRFSEVFEIGLSNFPQPSLSNGLKTL